MSADSDLKASRPSIALLALSLGLALLSFFVGMSAEGGKATNAMLWGLPFNIAHIASEALGGPAAFYGPTVLWAGLFVATITRRTATAFGMALFAPLALYYQFQVAFFLAICFATRCVV